MFQGMSTYEERAEARLADKRAQRRAELRYIDDNGRVACGNHMGYEALAGANQRDRMIYTSLGTWLRVDGDDALAAGRCETCSSTTP